MKLKVLNLLLAIMGIGVGSYSFAQKSVVFKCEDAQGVISYVNEQLIGQTCLKTDLGNIKESIKNLDSPQKTTNTNTALSSNKVNDFNKKISNSLVQDEANKKRFDIWTRELRDEKNALETVSKMLVNITDKNSIEAKQLVDLSGNHQRNIVALEEKLKKSKLENTGSAIAGSAISIPSIPAGLPFSIPKEEMALAIKEGAKHGNINDQPMNKLVVVKDVLAIPPANTIFSGYASLNNAKNAEDAVKITGQALTEAKKQLLAIEKRAKEAQLTLEKEKYDKEMLDLNKKLVEKTKENNLKQEKIQKVSMEMSEIIKRQNLRMEERNFLWKKIEKLENEEITLSKDILSKRQQVEEINKLELNKKLEQERKMALMKKNEEAQQLLIKEKELANNKLKVLEEKLIIVQKKKELNEKQRLSFQTISKDIKYMIEN